MEGGAEAATFLVSQRQASADPPHDGVHDREAKAGPSPVATCTAVEAFAGVREILFGHAGSRIDDLEADFLTG